MTAENRCCPTLALALALSMPALGAAETAVYRVDSDHSSVGFSIRHFVTKVPGRFQVLDGTIHYDRENPAASRVELTVSAASPSAPLAGSIGSTDALSPV